MTFQDRGLERIREMRAAELASEQAKRSKHSELGRKFIARFGVPGAPADKLPPRDGPASASASREKGLDAAEIHRHGLGSHDAALAARH